MPATSPSGRLPRTGLSRRDAGTRWERRLFRLGYRAIAGVDEVGRGSWAGPLVAAAVILPPPSSKLVRMLKGLRDSKQLTPARRDHFCGMVSSVAVAIGFGVIDASMVDRLGLTLAGQAAMQAAIADLGPPVDYVLVDAFPMPRVGCPQEAIIRGDTLCLSIAAASVVAKVRRDRMLAELAARYPHFGFERNRGYGTAEHARALELHGVTPEHRRSFAPVARLLSCGESQ